MLAWLQMIASVIVGIVLATYTRETDTGLYSSETDHPFVAYGIGVAIGGIAFGVLMLVVGTLAVYITGRDAAAVFSAGAAT